MSRDSTYSSRRASARIRRHSEIVDDEEPQPHQDYDDSEGHEVESEETPRSKKRRSTRDNQINYSSTRRNLRTNAKSNHKLENSTQVMIRKDKNGTYIEDTQALEEFRKSQNDSTQIEKLGKLSKKHDLLTHELFHLQEYTSLASWDPEIQPSKYYRDFVEENHNLWNDSNEEIPNGESNKRSRKSRHSSRVNNAHPLQLQVDEAASKFTDQIINPTKFYEENFVFEKTSGSKILKESKEPSKKRGPMVIQPISTPKKSASNGVKLELETSPAAPKRRGRPKGSSNIKKATKFIRVKKEESSDDDKKGEVEQEDVDDEELPVVSSDSEFEVESPPLFIEAGSIPKVKVKLSLPKPTITNPDHVPHPEFGSLENFLESFKSLDEDMSNEEFDEYIQDQRSLVDKIKRAVNNNVLTIDDDFSFSKVPPPFPFRNPLLNQHTHNDHLAGQAVHMSKLFENSKKARIQRARKIANMVEVHFRRAAGAAERAKKEEERSIKQLARNAVQVVKKRWMLAERAYRILKNQEAEELRRIKGKEHLSQMLEHSTQLLEAQMAKRSDNEDDELEMLSGDEISQRKQNGNNDQDDANLTVEELRAKYAHLQDMDVDMASDQEEKEEEVKDDENNEDETTPVEIPELTEQEKQAIEEANDETNSILDSDDSLESESSDDDSDEESEVESEDEISSRPNGLAALFGITTQGEESDDESMASYDEEQEHESAEEEDEDLKLNSTPSSKPDIIEKSEPGSQIEIERDDSIRKSRSASHEPNDGVVDVPNPDLLLRGDLRIYQKQGLNWLASLYNNHTNGILADEMGLGKTIQTISLLCYLAVNKGIWGPHLIVVPTSVILNWEMEFKRFAPGFKVMVYYGSPQQRKEKRKGWNKPDTFHVCITSYQLVCQDQQIFRRKRWRYMILDEAHNIKNFKSNRWNALLNFNTENRLLLTGTPLQNNIMELWSLLYFLMPSTKMNQSMPSGFANLDDFQQWFGKPVDKIIEGGDTSVVDDETRKTVHKLHQVLRPYLLRRLKADVESQMPAKHEHVVYCRLSKRQYKLYHEYLARSDTKETLKNANYISIINALMQLRKVCNHPDLFEERPITTSFAVPCAIPTDYGTTNTVVDKLLHIKDRDEKADLSVLNLIFTTMEYQVTKHQGSEIQKLRLRKLLIDKIANLQESLSNSIEPNFSNIKSFYQYSKYHEKLEILEKLKQTLYLNDLRTDKVPQHGYSFIRMLNVFKPVTLEVTDSEEFIKPLESRIFSMKDQIDRFAFVAPAVVTMNMKHLAVTKDLEQELVSTDCKIANPFHELQTKLSIQFPDKSLLLYDCGKLQKLAKLLQQLKDGGHRALIFTQMTKVLDVLEQFLNIMGVRYMRLDGATKIEDRQILTERFNSDPRITVFILSTRSGGLGINLTGADTVIFYDSDWNPAMDKQCQDRCHRIGQTRDVHIYRFVSEYTIESNILKKANQKRHLDNVVIQEGEFTTDYFGKLSVQDLIGDEVAGADPELAKKPLFGDASKIGNVLAQAEDDADAQAAQEAMKEVDLDNEDFNDAKTPQFNSTSATPGVENSVTAAPDDDEFDDEEFGHIDEYMIRYIANGYYYD